MSKQLRAEPNALSTASLLFGILALLTSVTVVLVPFNASLAIMFSWLSRGNKKMCPRAIVGNVMAVVSVIIALGVLAALFLYLLGRAGGMGSMTPQEIEELFRQSAPFFTSVLRIR